MLMNLMSCYVCHDTLNLFWTIIYFSYISHQYSVPRTLTIYLTIQSNQFSCILSSCTLTACLCTVDSVHVCIQTVELNKSMKIHNSEYRFSRIGNM